MNDDEKPALVLGRKLIDAKQLADNIGVSAGHLAKQRVAGGGIPYIKVGRRVMYDPTDVAAWLDARRVGSTSQQVAA